MADKILILGGTKEAADLASRLVAEGNDVTTSLAGRTREPAPVAGSVRTGGLGGAQGLANWIIDNNITKLIDATHPFAEQISRNAKEAAEVTGVSFQSEQRQKWDRHSDDHWIEVDTLEEASAAIPEDARVLLALGSQHLSAFEARDNVHFVIRMVDPPSTPLPFKQHALVLGKPSSNWKEEAELLQRESITHIVCRNSGGTGAYAKIEASRHLALPVIILNRKPS